MIVDGYNTGAHLAPRFRQLGYRAVHVQSTPDLPEIFAAGCREADFERCILHTGDLAETLDHLAPYEVLWAIPGAEIGVPLADQLSECLGVPTNGTRRSAARRNKHEMARALQAAGVPAADGFASGDVDEIVAWAATRRDWPIVIKPVDSTGTEDVVFCESLAAVRNAFARIHGKTNRLKLLNTAVLAQEYLSGREYTVNMVSCDGVHAVCDIWLEDKIRIPGAGAVYDKGKLLAPEGPEQKLLVRYIERVLDALEIRWGPTHCEVMLTERGPILVEAAARMEGTIIPDAVSECVGRDHVTLTTLCYASGEEFQRFASSPYRLIRRALFVALVSASEGRIVEAPGLDAIRSLPTFRGLIGYRGLGERIVRTVDLRTSPGHVYLVGDSLQEVERDYLQIRELEREGLYIVSTD